MYQNVHQNHILRSVVNVTCRNLCVLIIFDVCSWEVHSNSQSWSDLSVTCLVVCIGSTVRMADLIGNWKLS